MAKLPEVVPLTDLRQDAVEPERVRGTHTPLIITRRGRSAAVLRSLDVYQRKEDERELRRALAVGDEEIASGEGHDLGDVLAEADALLASE